MRPDYSICIKPLNGEDARFEPVNLHFDAKYRVQVIQELFGGDSALECDGEELLAIGAQRRTAKRDDLLKMHAYRDAIRRSAGAYVIFPGGDETGSQLTYPEYHELLPGLGAFVLRPSEMGDAGGTSTLRRFLDDAIDHLAKRFSRHERGRYWVEEAYSPYGVIRRSLFPVGIPRDETTVLLGFVKSAAHWEWIRERKTYNVRAEGREGGVALNAGLLYSQLILLYGPSLDRIAMARIVSGPELIDLGAMKATGYPSPSSNYLCVQLSDVGHDAAVHEVSSESVERFVTAATGRRGQPMSVTWGQLRTQFGLKYAQE
jgi:hypothetical protein